MVEPELEDYPISEPSVAAAAPESSDKLRRELWGLCTRTISRKWYYRPQANQIIDRLYISDLYTATSEPVLAQLGITHILTVLDDRHKFAGLVASPDLSGSSKESSHGGGQTGAGATVTVEERDGVRRTRMRIKISDNKAANLKLYFDDIVSFIHDALNDPDARVLCHCFAGVSRSTAAIIAYLVSTGSTLEDAHALVESKRRPTNPNTRFIRDLINYEEELAKNTLEVASGQESGSSPESTL
jgi:hypothetical protein